MFNFSVENLEETLQWAARDLGFDKVQCYESMERYHDGLFITFTVSRHDIGMKEQRAISELFQDMGERLRNSPFMEHELKPYKDRIKELEEENSKLLETLTSGEEYISILEEENNG